MGNSNSSGKETYSSNQELIEINKLAQQYLTLLFKDDNLAIRDYHESKEEFMFRARPSVYLFDKLTFEQKKILVSEFYNISQELKYKILNTNDKLKYLQNYEILYKQSGGVSKYLNNSVNLNQYNSKLENEKLKLENEKLKLEIKIKQLDKTINNPNKTNYEELFVNGDTINSEKQQPNKIKYAELIKICAHKLADWDSNVFGNIPRNLVYKSPVHYKDMLEDILNTLISIDDLLTIINDLYIEIEGVEKNCYNLKTINETQLLENLNQIFCKDKYDKNNNIIKITEKFIPTTLGVRGETLRHGPTLWNGVDNYITLIKQRITIFREFYCNLL